MKLKNIKNKNFYSSALSPNFEYKEKRNIKFVIIHYTGMTGIKKVLKRFKDPASKVSCHWLISDQGSIFKIVEEQNIAWHCGISRWKKLVNLNKCSIGIELENPGHGNLYRAFSNFQMRSLTLLLEKIFTEYNIDCKNVLAHSDIAPERKLDPGELFRWDLLAKKKLAFFPPIMKRTNEKKFLFQIGDSNNLLLEIKRLLNKIGYKCILNKEYDLQFKLIIEAFQRRFYPKAVNGIIDNDLYNRINQVFKNS